MDCAQKNGILYTTDKSTKLNLQAEFDEPGIYTVQFGIEDPELPYGATLGSLWFHAIADITWSVAGANIRRRVSIGNGAMISGPCQAVKVVAYDATDIYPDPVLDGAVTSLKVPYTVTIQCTKGTRPNGGRPTLRQSFYGANDGLSMGLIAPLGLLPTERIYVPKNVGVTSCEVVLVPHDFLGFTSGVIVEQHVEQPGSYPSIIAKAYNPTINTGFIDIAPNVSTLQIRNYHATETMRAFLTWGIDG